MKVTLNGGFIKEGDVGCYVTPLFETVELPEGRKAVYYNLEDLIESIVNLMKDLPEDSLDNEVILEFLVEDLSSH